MFASPKDVSSSSDRQFGGRMIGCALGLIAILVGCQWLDGPAPPPPSDEEIKALRAQGRQREQRMREALSPPVESNRVMPPTVEQVIPVLEPYREWTLAETAQDSLSRIGPAAVPDVLPLLNDPDPEVRLRALRVLARVGPEASAAVPAVRRCVSDPDRKVRRMAVRALGQIGADAASAVPDLIELLRADESEGDDGEES